MTHRSEPQTNIPVTGVDVTAQQSTNTEETREQPVTETAPTEFTLRYEVAEGSESYIEVYVDDEVQESSTVDGPAQQSYTSSGTIRFVSTETSGVTLYINDEAVTLETNDSGIVNTTFTFEEILNQWYENHPNATRDTTQQSSSNSSNTFSGSISSSSQSSSNARSGSSTSSSQE